MQERYGIDLGEPGLLERRSGRWLEVRIRALVHTDSRLHYALYPPSDETAEGGTELWQ